MGIWFNCHVESDSGDFFFLLFFHFACCLPLHVFRNLFPCLTPLHDFHPPTLSSGIKSEHCPITCPVFTKSLFSNIAGSGYEGAAVLLPGFAII